MNAAGAAGTVEPSRVGVARLRSPRRGRGPAGQGLGELEEADGRGVGAVVFAFTKDQRAVRLHRLRSHDAALGAYGRGIRSKQVRLTLLRGGATRGLEYPIE